MHAEQLGDNKQRALLSGLAGLEVGCCFPALAQAAAELTRGSGGGRSAFELLCGSGQLQSIATFPAELGGHGGP